MKSAAFVSDFGVFLFLLGVWAFYFLKGFKRGLCGGTVHKILLFVGPLASSHNCFSNA
jgi:hypothetical protein